MARYWSRFCPKCKHPVVLPELSHDFHDRLFGPKYVGSMCKTCGQSLTWYWLDSRPNDPSVKAEEDPW